MKGINTLAVLFLFSGVFAQQIPSWYSYLGNFTLKGNWNFHNEVQWRNYDSGATLEQFMLRNGIGYNLSDQNNNVLVGYAFVHAHPSILNPKDQELWINEHRFYQQFISKQRFDRFYLTHRYRFEQRHFETSETKLRFRYWLAVFVALNNQEIKKNTIFLSAYNEIFIQNNDTYFERNRFYGALGYAITDHMKLEVGMLHQRFENRHTNHFQITLINNLGLRFNR